MFKKNSDDPQPADKDTTDERNFTNGFSFDNSNPVVPQHVRNSIENDRNNGLAFLIHGWVDGKDSNYEINGHGTILE